MADDYRNERASLGCGALLLIVMAGLFFFRPGMTELEREVRNTRSEVGELKGIIEAQSAEIRALYDRIEKGNGKVKSELDPSGPPRVPR